jgi:hypothetical protein
MVQQNKHRLWVVVLISCFGLIGGPGSVVGAPLYKPPIFFRADSDEEVLDLRAMYDESLEIAREQPTLPDGSQLSVN